MPYYNSCYFIAKILSLYFLATICTAIKNKGHRLTKTTEKEISKCLESPANPGLSTDLLITELSTKYHKVNGRKWYEDFLSKTTISNQQRNMCILQICLDHLKTDGLTNLDGKDNISKLFKIDSIASKYFKEYSKLYLMYHKKHEKYEMGLMNLNSFCLTQTCIADLQKNGFNTNSSSKVFTSKLKNNLQFASKLVSRGGEIVQGYKAHLELPASAGEKHDVYAYCVQQVCIGELVFAGFNLLDDGFDSYVHLIDVQEKIESYFSYDFIRLFSNHLNQKIKTGDEMGPLKFCSYVTTQKFTTT